MIKSQDYEIEYKNKCILVNLKEKTLKDFISFLDNNNINYLDITKVKHGSEKRYMEIFAKDFE